MLYLKLFVHLSMTWIILLWIFQGYSLFSYQCSLLFLATLICYHTQERLSTTFLFFFSTLSSWCVVVFDSFDILSSCLSFVKNFFHFYFKCFSSLRQLDYFIKTPVVCQQLFFKKIRTTHISNQSGERGIWTLAPVTRPIPLAGAPLRPLEYFSKVHCLMIWCCSMRSWRIYDNTKYFSVCQSLFFYIFLLPVTVASLKKFRLQNSPLAVVTICDMLLIRCSAILAECFLCNGNKVSYYSASHS